MSFFFFALSVGANAVLVRKLMGLQGRKYLDYDLEGLHVFLKTKESQRVIVAFEDSEAFDSGL